MRSSSQTNEEVALAAKSKLSFSHAVNHTLRHASSRFLAQGRSPLSSGEESSQHKKKIERQSSQKQSKLTRDVETAQLSPMKGEPRGLNATEEESHNALSAVASALEAQTPQQSKTTTNRLQTARLANRQGNLMPSGTDDPRYGFAHNRFSMLQSPDAHVLATGSATRQLRSSNFK